MIANPLENAVSNECTERQKNPLRIICRKSSYATRGKSNYFHEISNDLFLLQIIYLQILHQRSDHLK